jgi:ABC-type lipoprotein export system ATPase subunit
MAMLQNLHGSGLTIIVVTHEAEVARFAQRVVQFKDGLVIGDRLNSDEVEAAA